MADEEFERLKKRRLPVVGPGEPRPIERYELHGLGHAPGAEPIAPEVLKEAIIGALKTVRDPEIPLDLYSLGLIYDISVDGSASVHIQMTLTAPGCPVAGTLVREVQNKVCEVPGVRHATTELVWDPPWSRERMSDAARLALGLL